MQTFRRTLLFIVLLLIQINIYATETLIVEPDMGRAPLLDAINQAQVNVDVVMYGLTDESFTHALINAQSKHKNVRILLQHYPYLATDENAKAITELQAANMQLRWPDSKFKLTHQKTFLIDGQNALVLTFNLTHSSFTKERNFGLLISNDPLVGKIQQVFNADWEHATQNVQDPDLVYSPDNSREQILALIRQAHTSIKIYAEGLSDYEIVGALAKAAESGIKVFLLSSTFHDKKPGKQYDYLEQAGANIHFSKAYVIHAKVMIIDDKVAMLGSINFTKQSINSNRELSVIVHDPKIINQLNGYYLNDWHDAKSLAKNYKLPPKQTVKLLKYWLHQSRHYLN
jgi:cardiolipin synthase